MKFGGANHALPPTDELITFWVTLQYQGQGSRISQKIRIAAKQVLPRSE